MTESAFSTLPSSTLPEMQRTEISWAVLQLKALGVGDVLHFDFISPPPVPAMMYALELLFSLGALDDSCAITSIGMEMADMPLEPRLAKCLLSSLELGCSEEILIVAAMCSVDYPFITIRSRNKEAKQRLVECTAELSVPMSDHLTLLHIFQEYETAGYNFSWCDSMCLQSRVMARAREVRDRLTGMLKKYAAKSAIAAAAAAAAGVGGSEVHAVSLASCGDDHETVRKCLVCGYFANAAQLGSGGKYWTVRGRVPVSLHPTSVLARFGAPSEWVIFHEVTHGDASIEIREVSKIEPRWLLEFAHHYYDTSKIRK
jgi:HrpA-like RNA helicase